MSKETQQWLDDMILVGYTAEEHGRGDAWHRKQGNTNSFPDAVPYERAFELIAGWEPQRVTPHYEDENGEFKPLKTYEGDVGVALIHSVNKYHLGTFSEKYPTHGYKERLLDATAQIIDDNINIGSCGLLRGYRQAWLQIETPDTIKHSSGVEFRPHIVAMSSLDGSLATEYKEGTTIVVCDNTLLAFRREGGKKYKIRNTMNSAFKIADAREALDIVFEHSKEFEAELDQMLATTVTDDQWDSFKNIYIPVPEDTGAPRTKAMKKHHVFDDMWTNDPMVSPWRNTSWGVLQAVNTYREHYSQFKGDNRVEKAMIDTLKGVGAAKDQEALRILTTVL